MRDGGGNLAIETFQNAKTKKPSLRLGFQNGQHDAPGYPAKMWGSGRRARDVMPEAIRAALVPSWASLICIRQLSSHAQR
jgi:hypothetical protein